MGESGAARLFTIALAVVCGCSHGDRTPAKATGHIATAPSSKPASLAGAEKGAAPPDSPPDSPPSPPDDSVADEQLEGSLPAARPGVDDPPDVAAFKARIIGGEHSPHMLKEAQKLSYKHPKNAEVAYILGELYCDKLWMSDGIKALERALELDPGFRTNPYMIKSVVRGLGNDGDHAKVERFLVHQVGKPAAPFLQEVLQSSVRQQVKDRAAATLRELK